MLADKRLRWFAMGVLVLSSGLNYLDRMVFSALMPTLRTEFQSSGEGLGNIIAIFSIPYALASPFMGFLIDRVGLKWGASLVVGLWSMVGIGTGFVGGLASLMICRALLGVAESGGIPATGKGSAVYLEPQDRALGSAISQIGITLGSMAAPVLTSFMSRWYGWRYAFVVAGLLGFVWIPLWIWTASKVPAVAVATDPVKVPYGEILRDRRYQALLIANILSMTVYSLWTNWPTMFLYSAYHLTEEEANLRFAWIPPIFMTLGALFGGWLAQRLIRAGDDIISARLKIALGASLFVLATAAAPMLGSPALATAAICVSVFAVSCLSVNYYSIPLDMFGAGRAAFAISFLTGAYGLMQAFIAPQIGRWSDTAGWTPVCLAVALLPFISVLVLRAAFRRT